MMINIVELKVEFMVMMLYYVTNVPTPSESPAGDADDSAARSSWIFPVFSDGELIMNPQPHSEIIGINPS